MLIIGPLKQLVVKEIRTRDSSEKLNWSVTIEFIFIKLQTYLFVTFLLRQLHDKLPLPDHRHFP